jgi:integrase/recombinase XerC/integrase/recombinase XerD
MINNFLESLRSSGKSELTIRQYRSSLARFAGWLNSGEGATPGGRGDRAWRKGSDTDTQFFKNSDTNVSQRNPDTLAEATQLDIANFKRWASQKYKPRTVSLNMIHLNAYFRYLVAHGVVPDNPCLNVDPVTVQQEAPKWLDRNEQNSLVRAVRKNGDLRELTIITVLLHTGLRVQELCDLRVKDVVIRERKGTLIVQQGKGGKYREVPLNVDARRAIEDYLANGRTNGSEYLFTTQRS